MITPAIGPTISSTIFSRDAETSADLWCRYLYQHRHDESCLSQAQAEHWGLPALVGCKAIWLANQLNEPWLRIINVPEAEQRRPFTHYGWMSLEISVEDVDALSRELANSPLEIIGQPANLDISDDIRAMQVVGLDGEVLYLTQIKAPVPPFELPATRCPVDRLFIPVALVPDRARAAATYEQFEHTKAMLFDTKITVLNNALAYPIEQQQPVAAVQLAGGNLVELDQVPGLQQTNIDSQYPLTGIGIISFAIKTLPANVTHYTIKDEDSNRRACVISGGGNTIMELIEFA